MTDDGGYTRSYRRKWDNPVFRNLRDAGIWSWMTDSAVWKDTKIRFCDRLIFIKRGQLVTSERFVASGFDVDRQVIRRIWDALEDEQMITRQKTHGGTLITICNYDIYQPSGELENPLNLPSQTHVKPTSNPNKKEVKEVKNIRNKDSPIGVSLFQSAQESTNPVIENDRQKRGTRIPPDWAPSIAGHDFARNLGLNPQETFDQFRDYWLSVSGAKGCRSDWDATWRTWCRRANDFAGRGRSSGNRPKVDGFSAAMFEILAEGNSAGSD